MDGYVDNLVPEDWPRVREIFLEGIATGLATFETQAPSWEEWDAKHVRHSRLVFRASGDVAGWAALAQVSTRAAYAGVCELSIYVAASWRGLGIGARLLDALIRESEANGIWTLQAGVFPENQATVALHTHRGFRIVGRRERIGRLGDQWRDTLLLERRSGVVG